MRFKLNKRRVLLTAANAASLTGFLVFSLIGGAQARSQTYNYAAERWQNGDEKTDYAQISCFFPGTSGFSTDSLGDIRTGILNALQKVSIAPGEGQTLCPDSYSAPLGSAEVRGDISGKSEAEITAVGGDFFLIHDFELIDGAFFSDEDLMQDGAVIDRNLAWSLYGSYEVSGMKLTINGIQYYISGVIENPENEVERQCSGELPRAYISYDGASGFASEYGSMGDMGDGSGFAGGFSAVTCYEVIVPDPVENFAYKSVKELVEVYGASVIQNSGRFGAFKRLGALKNISSQVVHDSEIAYPYWENASRIVQFRLSYIYLCAALCLALPAITLVWLIFKAFIALKENKKRIFRAFCGLIRRLMPAKRGKINEGQKN